MTITPEQRTYARLAGIMILAHVVLELGLRRDDIGLRLDVDRLVGARREDARRERRYESDSMFPHWTSAPRLPRAHREDGAARMPGPWAPSHSGVARIGVAAARCFEA